MQGEKQYKTGLDVGSTTAKIVIIDESGQTVFSRYERHNAQVNDLLSAYFREARQELGDIETSIAVTGSVGMGTQTESKPCISLYFRLGDPRHQAGDRPISLPEPAHCGAEPKGVTRVRAPGNPGHVSLHRWTQAPCHRRGRRSTLRRGHHDLRIPYPHGVHRPARQPHLPDLYHLRLRRHR